MTVMSVRTARFRHYPAWIRTRTSSTKNCCATVTPRGNHGQFSLQTRWVQFDPTHAAYLHPPARKAPPPMGCCGTTDHTRGPLPTKRARAAALAPSGLGCSATPLGDAPTHEADRLGAWTRPGRSVSACGGILPQPRPTNGRTHDRASAGCAVGTGHCHDRLRNDPSLDRSPHQRRADEGSRSGIYTEN
jgi:hypothetical protein